MNKGQERSSSQDRKHNEQKKINKFIVGQNTQWTKNKKEVHRRTETTMNKGQENTMNKGQERSSSQDRRPDVQRTRKKFIVGHKTQ